MSTAALILSILCILSNTGFHSPAAKATFTMNHRAVRRARALDKRRSGPYE